MNLVLEREQKIENDDLKTPLYRVFDCQIIIKSKEGKKVFNLDEITNIRLQAKRNFSINIPVLFSFLAYVFTADYFDINFIFYIILTVFIIILTGISMFLEDYIYVLFVNTSGNNYVKLRMSEKDVTYAFNLVVLFESGYLNKYK